MSGVFADEILKSSISFDEYLQLTKDIVDGKITPSGMYANESTFRYTGSNLKRMNLVLEQMTVSQKLYNLLSDIREEWIWVVLSEPWCGDASWSVPALYILSSCNALIDLKIFLRDQNPEVMAMYQTEGADSIPKMICLRKADSKELGVWGPRPQKLQSIVNQFRADGGINYREGVRWIHQWYEEDMARTIQEEMIEEIRKWKSV